MADDTQRLIVSLEAQVTKFERALNKANGVAQKNARSIERRFDKLNGRVSAQLKRLGGGLVGAFASAQAVRAAVQFSDAATRVENSLKAAGLAGANLEKVYDSLFQSAQRNAAPLESLVQLYSRAALVQEDLGVTTEELLNFTDKVSVALRVSGQSAEEARGALLQLSQGLGSGIIRAEEFNAILEGALPIAQAAAAGLEEAGGSVAKLRQLVVDGKVSSEAFFRAFEAGAITLEKRVADAETTVSQQFVRLQNVMIDTAGKFNDATGASDKTGMALKRLADLFEAFGGQMENIARGPIGDMARGIGELEEKARSLATFLYKVGFNDSLVQAAKDFLAPSQDAPTAREKLIAQIKELEEERSNLSDVAIGNGFTTEQIDREITALERRLRSLEEGPTKSPHAPGLPRVGDPVRTGGGAMLPPAKPGGSGDAVTTVSLFDYKLPAGKGKKTKLDAYHREIAQILEATDALRAETRVRAGLNPLVDDYGYAVEKAMAKRELLTAAEKAGIAVTPELEAEIEGLAEGYATASVEAQKLAESQADAVANAEEMRDTLRQSIGDIINDLVQGRSAAEAFASALSQVGSRLLGFGLDTLFGGGSSGSGVIGSIFGFADGGIAANGRPQKLKTFARGGVSRSAAIFAEAGPEAAVPLPDGRRIPVDMRFPSPAEVLRGAGGSSEVEVRLAPGLEGSIIREAEGQTVRIVKENNRRAVPKIARDAAGRARRMSTRPGYED
jgi:tape measure domain-containing protein